MFSSGSGGSGGFDSFRTQNTNLFGPNEGLTAVNSFQPIGNVPDVTTRFGQSRGGIGNQLPLPSSSLAGTRRPEGDFSGFPQRGLARNTSMVSGRFVRAATSGNPFGLTNQSTAENNDRSSMTLEFTPSFSHDDNLSSTSTSTRSSIGSATEGSGQSLEQVFEPGGNTRGVVEFDNEAIGFGTSSTPFRANGSDFGGGPTVFGAPLSKRGSNAFSQGPDGFESASTAAPYMSQITVFGNQPSGVRVQKKKRVSPNAATSPSRAVDSFAAATSRRGAPSAFHIQTTFGAAAGGNAPTTSHFIRKPFSDGSAAAVTAFGGTRDNRHPVSNNKYEAMAGEFPSTNKKASMETRMSGTSKASFGSRKRGKGSIARAEADSKHVGERRRTASYSPLTMLSADDPDDDIRSIVSRTKGNAGKRRQSRHQNPVSNTHDDETSFVSMSPAIVGDRDENNKAQLSAAANLDGLCTDMCSQVERELHIRVDELSVFEKCFPGQYGTERDTIIKRFQRSSADHKLDIPDEIRPPGVLRRTQLYIEQAIMDLDRCGLDPRFQPPRAPEPIELYNFCWDRFRMIRKDCVLQNYRGAGGRVHPIVLDIHERIARYHVLSEHELIETPSFVAQQNMEQLGQTLKSLNELYDESHKVADPAYFSPFEAEFRAYFILCTLDNGRGMDVLKYVKDLPRFIVESSHVKFAMRVFVARQTGDYYQFFSLLREGTYLQSCLLSRYIPNVRSSALLRMNRSYRSQTYPLEDLADLLCFDDVEHAYAVCREHQIEIIGHPDIDDENEILVKFGGSFETDAQLRRNNRPLKIRGSTFFIGIKQGIFLRRDVCRGVTEYPRNDYPALSKLIQEMEQEEQARLYPDRPEYTDKYSRFVDFTGEDAISSLASDEIETVDDYDSEQHRPKIGQKRHLETIAHKQQELEQERQMMLERMRRLEQAKEEKSRRERYIKAAAEEAARREEQIRRDALARDKAEKEAAEARQRQIELEARLREQKQRELQEQYKLAERAREAERQRLAALQHAEAMRAKAAEEERRRQEERQNKIRRKVAEELERRRQQELAEERARQAREAELEAQRQAQLAKERERKRVRRAGKHRLAVLKLRLHLWKKYVQVSRNGPGPISIDATKLRLGRPHQKAKDSIQWLFGGTGRVSAPPTKKTRLSSAAVDASPSHADILSLWCADDIQDLVSGPLCRQNPGLPSIAWKLVIADLMDGASSSFGLWCAVRAGAQNVSVPERDCHRTFQWSIGKEQGVAVCSRYLDSTFTERNTHKAQQEKLAGTSAILLPVDVSTLHVASNCSSWVRQVEDLLACLSAGCRVTLFALGFASTEVESSRKLLVTTLEGCMERMRSRFASQVVHTCVEVMDAGDLLPHKFRQVLKTIATLSPPVRHLESVGLKELLESSMGSMLNRFEASVEIQSNICDVFRRVHEDICASGVMDLTYSPPEVQYAVMAPSYDWNSEERRDKIKTILTALEATRIAVVDSSVACDEACDVYFKRVANFIDRLFDSHSAAPAVSTYELKKTIFSALLPVHEALTQDSRREQVTPRNADVLLPWRKIFKEIYETFFETLDDITIYYPADWRKFGTTVSTLLDAAHSSIWAKLSASSKMTKGAVVDDSVARVTVQSIRKSFGLSKAPDGSTVPQKYRAMDEINRLRAEIKSEKAVTTQFQRMLRQALDRWDQA